MSDSNEPNELLSEEEIQNIMLRFASLRDGKFTEEEAHLVVNTINQFAVASTLLELYLEEKIEIDVKDGVAYVFAPEEKALWASADNHDDEVTH